MGGIIAVLVDILLVFIAIAGSSPGADILALNMVQTPFTYFLSKISYESLGNRGLLVIGGLLCWSIIGIIIGWLYGKIKNGNKVV